MLTKNRYKILLFLIQVLIVRNSFCQDITTFKDAKPFDISGNFSIGAGFFQTSRELPRLAPFSYIITGNPVISVYNVKIPLSFTYSNQQVSYVKPFQRYGASPNYKWIKLHLGHRVMEFTPYSLSGQTFLGAGIELTPGNFEFLAFYGKFENIFAVYDPFAINVEIPKTYKRNGFGFKIGYGNKKAKGDISLIKIADKVTPDDIQFADSLYIKPKENIVVSPSLHFFILKHLKFSSTAAASIITNNKLASSELLQDITDKYSEYFTINQSTKIAFAGDITTELIFERYNLGVKYQRIEPLYKSLGLYGIANDFENYTVNAGVNFLNKQVQLQIRQGYQRNNLSNLRKVTDLQKIGSYSVNIGLKSGLNINAHYSNFQNDQRAGYVEINDTIRLALIGKNGSITSSYRWKSKQKNRQHTLSFFGGMQSYKDVNPDNIVSFDNQNTSANINYKVKFKPKELSLKTGVIYSSYQTNNGLTSRMGVMMGVGKKTMNKKTHLRLRTSFQKSNVDNQDDGYVIKGKISANHKLNNKNSISLQASVLERSSIIKEPFTDYRGRISYIYKF